MLFERLFKPSAERLIARGNRAEKEGRLGEACELYRQAVAIAPAHAKAHLNLGIALEAMGDIAGAVGCHEKALEIDAAEPYANYNLGRLRYAQGELAQAERLLGQALRGRPDFAEARIVLGGVLDSLGSTQAAAAEFEAALAQRPKDFGALYRYAGVLSRLGRMEEAASALARALELEPQNVDARAGLYQVLAPNDPAGAARELEALLKQRPDWADAHYNYACVLRQLMRPTEAEQAARRALEIDPRHARAYRLLGTLILGRCRVEEALALYEKARQLCPDDFDLESAELFALTSSEHVPDDTVFSGHAAFGARIEAANPPRFEPHRNARDPERRLRIGYVSGDFYYHVVTLFATPVIERHDRSAVEVFCYSTAGKKDDYTRALTARAEVWREASALSHAELADAIHADGIDILVDLAGHSGDPRLGVFAQRPAPVQATWLGYLNTTGLTRIDYRISDRHADPPGLTERLHSEKLVRLPHSQWCYRPFMSAPLAPAPPCVRHGHVTFGSFNQPLKLSRASRSLWAQILSQVPGSRLLVLGISAGRAQEELARDLAVAGIASERLTLMPYVALQDYMRWFDAVDIALDSTPYSGGTTTCDALWMGVPVITAPGTRPVSRSAASILATVGLAEWIAPSSEEYVRRAVAFSQETEILSELRASLRPRMQASPLMDEEGFTRDLEQAYREMWRRWCATR
jgi:predicted O-linked N-acetylglucosamine transferase (SPINDLY family)